MSKMIEHEYDHILIDCPPPLSMLTINALAAADSVSLTKANWTNFLKEEYGIGGFSNHRINANNQISRAVV